MATTGSQPVAAERVAGVNTCWDRLPVFGHSPVVLVVVGASYFLTFYDITAIGVTLPVLEERFRLSGADLALPVTTNLFAYIVGADVLSSLADCIGHRRALALSVVLLSVGAVLTALSGSVTRCAIFRAVTGLGMGAEIALAATITTELCDRGRCVDHPVRRDPDGRGLAERAGPVTGPLTGPPGAGQSRGP